MANESAFSWFNLTKYEPVKDFDIQDWHYQLSKRFVANYYPNLPPEFIRRLGDERSKKMKNRGIEYIKLIKEDPILKFTRREKVSSIRTVTAEDRQTDVDLWGIQETEFKVIQNSSDAPFTALIMVNLKATNEQLTIDFSKWLKNYRVENKWLDREKMYTQKDFKLWVRCRILCYLDLTIIASYEGKILTQNKIGKMLFPGEFDVDITERIRNTVKPKAEGLMWPDVIAAMEAQIYTV